MTRQRGAPSSLREVGPSMTGPIARIGGAVLRGIAVHHEARALPRHPHPERREDPADFCVEGIVARDAAADAPLPPSAPPSFDEGRLAGYAEAEAAQRAAAEEARRRGYEAGLEQGVEDGRRQGLAQGREAGRQAFDQEAHAAREATAARLAELDRLLSTLPAELARRLESSEDDMVALCHAIVCRILGEQLVTREGVAHAVRQAIREREAASALDGAGGGPFAVRLHPRDLELLRGDEHVEAWLRERGASSSGAVHWIADPSVQLGGCLVSSGEGSLDARIETQLAALRELLLERRSAGSQAPAIPPGPPTAPAAGGREDGR